MADIEVHIDFASGLKRVGTLHRHARRGGEALSFEYHGAWLEEPARFSLEPALSLGRGAFVPANGSPIFGSIGDSAPDTWRRRLMQRAERRRARLIDEISLLVYPGIDGLAGVPSIFEFVGGGANERPANGQSLRHLATETLEGGMVLLRVEDRARSTVPRQPGANDRPLSSEEP